MPGWDGTAASGPGLSMSPVHAHPCDRLLVTATQVLRRQGKISGRGWDSSATLPLEGRLGATLFIRREMKREGAGRGPQGQWCRRSAVSKLKVPCPARCSPPASRGARRVFPLVFFSVFLSICTVSPRVNRCSSPPPPIHHLPVGMFPTPPRGAVFGMLGTCASLELRGWERTAELHPPSGPRGAQCHAAALWGRGDTGVPSRSLGVELRAKKSPCAA